MYDMCTLNKTKQVKKKITAAAANFLHFIVLLIFDICRTHINVFMRCKQARKKMIKILRTNEKKKQHQKVDYNILLLLLFNYNIEPEQNKRYVPRKNNLRTFFSFLCSRKKIFHAT